ncbi:isoleucine--tRNA ligase [Candidatus Parvarchaeota archaeon]|nr:isoleucine--tRNA ligase [Candidatus Parvarchaeota archaeon]
MADFYNSKEIETKIISRWKRRSIIDKIKKRNLNKNKFYFLDGPPFVTNEVHQGTMLGIFIKDSMIRFRQLGGFDVRARPGWDTHGLPIEVIVEKKLGIKNKKEIKEFGEERFIEECKRFVEEHIASNTSLILDYGVLWYGNAPYRTYDDNYIESVWAAIKKADEMNLLYEGFKSTWFCVRCSTPMANYEVRDKYYEKEDESVYVLFRTEDGRHLLIWTTTPWTLPSNVAIAVNSGFLYVEAEAGDRIMIIAKDRLEVLDKLGINYKIKREFEGMELIGLRYEPVFPEIPQVKENSDKIGIVIDGASLVSDEGVPFVDIKEGTGLVHVATGHGESDYKIGMMNGLPILSPVDENGRYTYKAGWLENEEVLKAGEKIIKYLEDEKALFGKEKVLHMYPHCWRCKTPLIPRASNQWFLNISKIKRELVDLSRGINWAPPLSENTFASWLSNAQDWVISRQRYWNTPLPIWVCKGCKQRTVVGSKAELLRLSHKKDVNDLHKSSIDGVKINCEKCGGNMERVPDVLDVWIDSGSASFADLHYPASDKEFSRWFPADFITEGNDQIRGWFYSLLVMGYIATGRLSFKNVLMHKFVVGENGAKLSKSEGNYKPLLEMLNEGYSRDALRISLLKHGVEDVAVFTLSEVKDETKTINVVYNLCNLYTSCIKILAGKKAGSSSIKNEDKWILSRWNTTKKLFFETMEGFRIDRALNLLINFIVEDFSRTYVKLAKTRIFDEYDYPAFEVFSSVFKETLPLLSVFAPFISEYSYDVTGGKESVMLSSLPAVDESKIDAQLETKMATTVQLLQDVLSSREKARIPVKRPISMLFITELKEGDIIEDIIHRLGNVLHISYSIDPNEFEVRLNFESLKARYKQADLAVVTAKFLELTKETLLRNLAAGISIGDAKNRYQISKDDIILVSKKPDLKVSQESHFKIIMDSSLTDEVKLLWTKREIIRTIQGIRKELGMERDQKIKVSLTVNGSEKSDLLETMIHDIKARTNSELKKGKKLLKLQDLNISGNNIVISVFR